MKVQVVFRNAEEGGYWAEVPALGCVTEGDTRAELMANLHDAIEGVLLGPEGQVGKVQDGGVVEEVDLDRASAALPDLLPVIRSLSRTDKLRLIEMLAGQLLQEEVTAFLEPDATYEVWAPIGGAEAAAVMLRELEKQQGSP